jgi:hypothetical protein
MDEKTVGSCRGDRAMSKRLPVSAHFVASVLVVAALAPRPAMAQPGWTLRVNAPPAQATAPANLVYDSDRGRMVQYLAGETWEWDGRTWMHVATATSPPVFYEAALAYDSARGRTVMVGYIPSPDSLETWEYDGVDWTRAEPTTTPPARFRLVLAFDEARGRTILFGGQDLQGPLGDTWLWDGAEWTQAHPSTAPPARVGRALVYDPTQERVLLLLGGSLASGEGNQVWAWDGAEWAHVGDTTAMPRVAHAMSIAFVPPRHAIVAYFAGGQFGDPEVWEWDGATTRQIVTPTPPPRRLDAGFAFDPARECLVLVGSDPWDTWELDRDDWREAVPPRGPRTPSVLGPSCLAFDEARGRGVFFPSAYDDGATWEWDGERWRRARDGAPTNLVGGFFPVYDGTNRCVVGTNPSISSGLWSWDGSRWTFQSSYHGIAMSWGACTAFDSWRGVLVASGASATYEWDGSDWRWLPSSVELPKDGFAMAYDSIRRRTVLFGGGGSLPFFGTFEWDGTSWHAREPEHRPPGRMGAAMAFDPDRESVVMFGGTSGYPSYFDDTWEWDGTDWREIDTPSHPSARTEASMTYDAVRHCLVLQGGYDDRHWFGDTWTLGAGSGYSVLPAEGSESGGDAVTLGSFGIGDPARLRVEFGRTPAEILRVDGDRVVVRTPPGAGTVDVGVHGELSSVTLPQAFSYGDPALLARWGDVGEGRGDRQDVLFVNALAGDPTTRELVVGPGTSLSVVLAAPPGGLRSRFVLYAWLAEPSTATMVTLPGDLGRMVLAPPFAGGSPHSIWNCVGHRRTLGAPNKPSTPAPSFVYRGPAPLRPTIVTIQGLVEDARSSSTTGLSVTNALVLRIE